MLPYPPLLLFPPPALGEQVDLLRHIGLNLVIACSVSKLIDVFLISQHRPADQCSDRFALGSRLFWRRRGRGSGTPLPTSLQIPMLTSRVLSKFV